MSTLMGGYERKSKYHNEEKLNIAMTTFRETEKNFFPFLWNDVDEATATAEEER